MAILILLLVVVIALVAMSDVPKPHEMPGNERIDRDFSERWHCAGKLIVIAILLGACACGMGPELIMADLVELAAW